MSPFSRRRRGPSRLDRLSLMDHDIREEIRFHLEMRVEELEGAGLAAEEAWQQAVDEFGDPDDIVEETRKERAGGRRWGWRWTMASLLQDLVFGVRTLVKRPSFTLAAVVSLGLGIGANSAMFSVTNTLLLHPLGLGDQDRLTPVYTSQAGGQRHGNTSFPDYLDYRDRNQVYEGLVAHTLAPMAVGGAEAPRVVLGQLVSWNYFDVLGVTPMLGRSFTPDEERGPLASPVAVLSHDSWRDLFGADPGILGQTVRINDHPFTVVGVAPKGFAGLTPLLEPAIWAPLASVAEALPFTPNVESRVDPWLQLVGRLKPGVDAPQAQAAMDQLARNLAQEFPETNRNKGIVVGDLDAVRLVSPEATAQGRRLLQVLLAVVGLVLLVACFNVANLQLAKATTRRQEIAIRVSLGASRSRIVKQLLVESVVLATLAGVFGLLIAGMALDALQLLQPRSELPIGIPFTMDGTVLGFTLLLSLASGVVFGLAPALQILKPDQAGALKDQGRGSSPSRSSSRIQNGLVVAQVALSLVLLASAGLFITSLRNTLSVDPGFDLRDGVIMPMNLGYGQYDEASGRELHQALLERVRAMPEVRDAALAAFAPLGVIHGRHDIWVDGYEPAPDELMVVMRNMVSHDYFKTMGIPVLQGRAIDEGDTESSQPVAVVNETLVRRFWPGQDPLGRTVRADLGITYTVVGVMEDGKYGSLLEAPEPYLVLPLTQAEYVDRMNLVVTGSGDPAALVRRLIAEVRDLAPALPPALAMTGPEYLEYSTGDARMPAVLVGTFGLLALILAAVGLFGVMWYAVTQRTREFGVRLALGASESQVVRSVLGKGLKVTLVGVALGLGLALLFTRILGSFLYGVGSADPLVFILVPGVLLGVGQLASFLPARHASRADPVVVLKAD